MKPLDHLSLVRFLRVIAPDDVLGCDAMKVSQYVERQLDVGGPDAGLVAAGLTDLGELTAQQYRSLLAKLSEAELFDLALAVAPEPWFAILTRWVAEAIY